MACVCCVQIGGCLPRTSLYDASVYFSILSWPKRGLTLSVSHSWNNIHRFPLLNPLKPQSSHQKVNASPRFPLVFFLCHTASFASSNTGTLFLLPGRVFSSCPIIISAIWAKLLIFASGGSLLYFVLLVQSSVLLKAAVHIMISWSKKKGACCPCKHKDLSFFFVQKVKY